MNRHVGEVVLQPKPCSWQLEAAGGPRADWESITPRRTGDSLAVPGVYVYWGRASETDLLSVYAGQTDAVSFRLSDHHKERPWLQFGVGVYSKGSPLDRSLTRVMEIDIVRELHAKSTKEKLLVETKLQELPITTERFLGPERFHPALQLIAGARKAISAIAGEIDPLDGARLARVLRGD